MTHLLPIVGYINPLVADALRDPTSGINTTQLRAEPNGCVSSAVVMKADADAVIARLREALTLFSEYEKLMDGGEDVAAMMVYADFQQRARAALKGPEA
ncbi:hypothetical protein QQM41_04605 [Acetobacter sp. AC2005]|uniref:hypothetical protein n=1 Tax=Acetobacter sp. AC2005 TaxID=3134142 RepID=UPI0030CD4E28